MFRKSLLSVFALATALFAQQAAQQAPAPGIPSTLGPGPWVFDTAEQHKILVSVVARGIPHPFGMTFIGRSTTLITERGGNLRLVKDGLLDPKPVAGVPQVLPGRGLLDIVTHPKFAE